MDEGVGGKARLAPWIIEQIKQHTFSIYCEPFAGSAAVYFRMISEGIPDQIRARGHYFRSVLNDADSRIVQLFKACRDYPEALAHAVRFTPYSREEHKLAQQPLEDLDDVEIARRTLVDGWMSVTGGGGKAWAIRQGDATGSRDASESQGCVNGWHTLPDRILTATEHLKKCYIEQDDAVKVIERWATPHTLFYADPPYVDCENYYAHNAKQSPKRTELLLVRKSKNEAVRVAMSGQMALF